MASSSPKKLPFEIVDIKPEVNAILRHDYSEGISQFVEVGPEKWIFSSQYREQAEEIYNFQVRPDDVWIMGFPRSGTNLMQDLAWLVVNDGGVDTAEKMGNLERAHFFDLFLVSSDGLFSQIEKETDPQERKSYSEILETMRNYLDKVAKSPSPRVIKTHIPFCLLPQNLLTSGCKIIYICRNVKDVLVSYHKIQSIKTNGRVFIGDLEKYWHYCKNDLVLYSPYWLHIKQAWDQRQNLKFMFYEDLNKNLKTNILDIAKFLNRNLSVEKLEKIANFLQFDNYQNIIDKHADKFEICKKGNLVRRGKVGGYKDYFTEKMDNDVEEWIKQNLRKIGMETEYPQNI